MPLDPRLFEYLLKEWPKLNIGKEVSDWYTDIVTAEDARVRVKTAEDAVVNHPNADKLYRFQRVGVDFITRYGRAGLFDETGMGKTVTTILSTEMTEHEHILGVCTKSMMRTWRNEITQWSRYGADMPVTVLDEARTARKELDAYKKRGGWLLVHWDQVARFITDIKRTKWDWITADEAHKMKNKDTNRFKAITSLLGSKRVLPVTGTPFSNHPGEVWTLLRSIAPGKYTSYWRFFNLHVATNPFTGAILHEPKHPDLMANELRANALMRYKKDFLTQLPDKTYQTIELELTKEQRVMYDEMANWLVAQLSTGEEVQAFSPLAGLLRLRQIASTTATLDDNTDHSSKLDATVDLILENTGKIVVFFQFRKSVFALCRRLDKLGIKYIQAVGGMKEDVSDLAAQFQEDDSKVFVATLDTGGEGLTLTKASTIVFGEKHWNPAKQKQAEDRCIEAGQLVQTKHGPVPIENVMVGDLVLTHTGKWQKVVGTHRREHRGLMTQITYARYTVPLASTHDHKLLVKRGDDTPTWVPAHTVLPGDMLVMPRPESGDALVELEFPNECRHCPTQVNQFGVTQKNGRLNVLPEAIEVDNELLFTFGRYLADGFASERKAKGSFVSISDDESKRHALEEVKERFEKLGVTTSIYTSKSSKAIELRAFSVELAKWFMFLFNTGAHVKNVPPVIMDLPPAQAWYVLYGYVYGDGYARKQQVEWASVSPALAFQMALLALKCGYTPSLRPVKGKNNVGQWIGGFTVNGKPASRKLSMSNEREVYHPVRRVETYRPKGGKVIVYDLTVEEDHSFVVGQAVVHNCHRISQTNPVTVISLHCTGTVDDIVESVVQRKMSVYSAIINEEIVSHIRAHGGLKHARIGDRSHTAIN